MKRTFIYLTIFVNNLFIGCTENQKDIKNIENSSKKDEPTPIKLDSDKKDADKKETDKKETDKKETDKKDADKKDADKKEEILKNETKKNNDKVDNNQTKDEKKDKINDQLESKKNEPENNKTDNIKDKKIETSKTDSMATGISNFIKNAYNPREISPMQRDNLNYNETIDTIKTLGQNASNDALLNDSINKIKNDENFKKIATNDYNHFVKIGLIKNKMFDLDSFINLVILKPFVVFPINIYEEYVKLYPQCIFDYEGTNIPCYWQYSEIIKENNLIDLIKNENYIQATNIIKKLIYSLEKKLQEFDTILNDSEEDQLNEQNQLQESKWILKDLERMSSNKKNSTAL